MKRFALLALISFAACVDTPATSEQLDEAASELTLSGRQCKTSYYETIGVCGADPNLLDACTKEFTTECNSGGGTVWPGVPIVIDCQDNSRLYHACDPKFKQSCKDSHGTFGCDNPDCTQGHCTIPD
jgi:hypothetical protein